MCSTTCSPVQVFHDINTSLICLYIQEGIRVDIADLMSRVNSLKHVPSPQVSAFQINIPAPA